PGGSQLCFTLAVRDAGASRTSLVVGMAPLASFAIALAVLGEPFRAARAAGAVLIVLGGATLLRERQRPAHFRLAGLGFAALAAGLFSTRDNLLRWLAVDTNVSPLVAATLALAAGTLLVGAYLLWRRGRGVLRASLAAAPAFAPCGLL